MFILIVSLLCCSSLSKKGHENDDYDVEIYLIMLHE